MGCDWIDGVASYGYSVDCNYFSYEKITCPNVEVLVGKESEMYEAKQYVSDCWNLFCKEQRNDESVKNIDCICVCKTMPCTHESFQYEKHSRFVFGYKIESGVPLDKLTTKLSKDLPKKIAQFVYLFNKTDTFADIWKEGQSFGDAMPIESVKINMELVQDVKEIDKLKKSINAADFVIGCK